MTEMTEIFSGRIIRLLRERVELPDGQMAELEVVRHPGGAAVVALDAEGRVCLLRQYRPVVSTWLWELPAGKLDPGEGPESTARRELAEEAGVEAAHWQSLGAMRSSPGVFDEMVHLFLAQGLCEVSVMHEAGEVIEIHWWPLSEAIAACHDGRISDAKTLIGLLRAQALQSVQSRAKAS